MIETMHPSVVVDGVTVVPEGWMWILGFAMAGIPWAVAEAEKPEFQAQVADYRRRCELASIDSELAHLEPRADRLRARRAELGNA
jgi:hypothetical protein